MWTKRHVDAREKVESGRDLVCVAVRCTGGEHIVMRAVSRVRYRRAVASDRKKAERKGPSQYLYWICCNFVLEKFPQNTELFGSFSQTLRLVGSLGNATLGNARHGKCTEQAKRCSGIFLLLWVKLWPEHVLILSQMA